MRLTELYLYNLKVGFKHFLKRFKRIKRSISLGVQVKLAKRYHWKKEKWMTKFKRVVDKYHSLGGDYIYPKLNGGKTDRKDVNFKISRVLL